MSRHRPRTRLLALAAAGAASALYALWIRPRLRTWGATRDETTGAYPGDELIPDADHWTTMATTLPGPPERVWAWLVQMGVGRGGWYSWDWLDNAGEPSADRIVLQWQHLEKGQRLNSMPGGRNWMTVAVLEPNRTLVLRSVYQLPSFRTLEMGAGPLPWAFSDAIWGFHLRPAPGDRTRLVARIRARGRPRSFTRLFGLVDEPRHFSMQTRQFHNLRVRVGRGDVRPAGVVVEALEGVKQGDKIRDHRLGSRQEDAVRVQPALSGHHATPTAQHGHPKRPG
jgi:hypothetical protein